MNSTIFGRINSDGNITVLNTDSGEPVTRIDSDLLYPVGSNVSSRYEHPAGIVLTRQDAERIGLEIE